MLLRPVAERDIPVLVALIAAPEVARWWGDYDAAQLRAELLDDERLESLVVERDGEVIGVVEITEEPDPDYPYAGLDIAIRAELHGKGFGRESLRVVIEHLIAARGHHRFTIDPAAENERAIRSYAGLGFRPVGVIRRYGRAPDGSWRDGLLMDLLAEELQRG